MDPLNPGRVPSLNAYTSNPSGLAAYSLNNGIIGGAHNPNYGPSMHTGVGVAHNSSNPNFVRNESINQTAGGVTTPGVRGTMDMNGNPIPGTGNTPGTDWAGVGAVMGGAAGLANAYTGLQQLGLAKDQFNFEKDAANRNILNQGTQINAGYANQRDVGLAMSGLSAEQKTAYNAANPTTTVNTSAIG